MSEPKHFTFEALFHVIRGQFEYQLGFVHRKNGNIQLFQGDREGLCPGRIN